MTTRKTGNTPGRSSRRSKPTNPVTIDLKAETVKADSAKSAESAKGAAASSAGTTAKSVPHAGPKRQTADSVGLASAGSEKGSSESKAASMSAAKESSAVTGSADKEKNAAGAGASQGKQSDSQSSGKDGGMPPRGGAKANETGKGGRSGALVGGLIGGVVALLAMYGVQYAGVLPVPDGSSAETETAAVSAEVGQLRSTVDQLSSTVSKLSMDGGGEAPDLSAITGRLDVLETAAANGTSTSETSPIVTELDSRISEISRRVDTLGAETQSTVANEISDLRNSLGEMAQQISALEASQSELTQSLTARIDKIEEAVNGPGKDLAMARAIAVSGLKTAIDRGGPFASELEAFASVSPDDPAVGDLRTFAATGVPTNGQLIADFPDAANRMIASANPLPEDAGLAERLWSSAQTVIKVRKVGDVEGDGTEAIVARMETHVKNGDLDAARAEWSTLPDEAKAAAEDFGKALAARAEIGKLLAAVQIAAPPPTAENIDQAADGAAPQKAE